MDSPFAMDFDELLARANANMEADKGQATPNTPAPTETKAADPTPTAQAEAAKTNKSFMDRVEEAERKLAGGAEPKETSAEPAAAPDSGVVTGISFDELLKAAQPQPMGDNAMNAPETPASETKAEAPAPEVQTGIKFDELEAQTETPVQGGFSFDELLAQAQAETASKAAPVEESTPVEEPAPVEEPVKTEESAPAEEPVKTEEPAPAEEPVKTEEPAPAEESVKAEEPVKTEAPAKEKQSRSKGSKKAKKDEDVKEPLPDTTNEYRVDVLGEGEAPAVAPGALAMESILTKEELDGFRKELRTLVYNEIKAAMVDAVKDVFKLFNE